MKSSSDNAFRDIWSARRSGYTKLDLYIRYDDELVKQDGRWRFLKRRLETLFTSTSPVNMIAAPIGRRGKSS